jgi:hypothetical protein
MGANQRPEIAFMLDYVLRFIASFLIGLPVGEQDTSMHPRDEAVGNLIGCAVIAIIALLVAGWFWWFR